MPAVALLGPRQCGKSTLAKRVIAELDGAVYLDLEKTSDLNKLRDPEAFFSLNRDKLVCLDEIQRRPELFAPLRAIIDDQDRNGQLLILGSASRDLIRQSSESLAGRTFLERDIPQLGFNIPARSLERLWRMCAHSHGQLLNASKIGAALGVSHHTVRSYMDILAETFLLRLLPPYEANIKKRLIKSPKIYLRDSGLLHALLDIPSQNDLLGHPVYGASWEGFVIESVIAATPDWHHFFYRTATGVELDLVLEKGSRTIGIECKANTAPNPAKGFRQALRDLNIAEAYLVAPVENPYPVEQGIQVVPVLELIARIQRTSA